MPLYEFRCRNCDHIFEQLVRDNSPMPCPACGVDDKTRVISRFAVSSEGTRSLNLAKARRANAGTVRDKQVADAEAYLEHQH